MTTSRSKGKMWKILFLVAVVVIAEAEGCTYKKRECPDYTVIEVHPDYEVRRYPVVWATTSELSRFRRVGQYETFMRLFRYISGQNDREQKMPMAVPVRMQTTNSGNGTLYEMSFMVPSEFILNPPVPNDKNINIVSEDVTFYAVRSFKGYIWRQGTWEEEAQKLSDSVKDDENVIKTNYYQVGYDAPFEFFDRRNEVWMVKKVTHENNEV